MVLLAPSSLSDNQIVADYIKSSFLDYLKYTTLVADFPSLDIEIRYGLSFRSDKNPMGYYFRVTTLKGFVWYSVLNSMELDKILAYLFSTCCTTKYGNSVNGWATVTDFVPRAKKLWKD